MKTTKRIKTMSECVAEAAMAFDAKCAHWDAWLLSGDADPALVQADRERGDEAKRVARAYERSKLIEQVQKRYIANEKRRWARECSRWDRLLGRDVLRGAL